MKLYVRVIVACILTSIPLVSCDSALTVLQGISEGMNGYSNSYQPSYYNTSTPSTTNYTKEWHNCSSCSGTGRCKYCGGSGKDEYTKNKRCGVCRGTGKCAGCNGRGGYNA